MRRHLIVSAFALVAVVAGSFTASAGEARRLVYTKTRVAQPVVAQPVAQVKAADTAQPNVAELRARIAELSQRVQALEAAAAEDRRQIANIASQIDQAAPVQGPVARPVVRRQVVEPTTVYSTDLFPNEYPYGG